MKGQNASPTSFRIAVLWNHSGLMAESILRGVYRWANLVEGVTLRPFNVMASPFRRSVVEPIVRWKPHGLIARVGELKKMTQLRERLPGVPFVMTNAMPSSIANTVVVCKATEAMQVALNHFQEQGVRTVALFCCGHAPAAVNNTAVFRSIAPDAPVLAHPMLDKALHEEVTVRDRQIVGGWLQSLPKPAGVLTLENTTGQFLLRVCQRVGLRVPQDIQIIGVDEADECLDCEPHLTSLQMPSERIGEIAMGAMLRYLGYQQPVPPRALYAEGITIIARGSTGLVPMALSNIATALNTIQTETGKGLTAKTVVAQSHVGHTTFYKQFRAATGATPARYLRQKRLDEACRMLKETSANITTIAGMCGFSSANYFAELFRRATGQSPRAYREQWRARSKSDAQPKRPHPS